MQLAIARTLLFLLGLAGAAAALTTDNVAQQLDVTPGGKLVVDVDFGTVEVSAGAENHVDVDAERRIETDNEAREREYLAAAPITVSKDGNTVTVRARRRDGERGWNCSGHCSIDAHYLVKVP